MNNCLTCRWEPEWMREKGDHSPPGGLLVGACELRRLGDTPYWVTNYPEGRPMLGTIRITNCPAWEAKEER